MAVLLVVSTSMLVCLYIFTPLHLYTYMPLRLYASTPILSLYCELYFCYVLRCTFYTPLYYKAGFAIKAVENRAN